MNCSQGLRHRRDAALAAWAFAAVVLLAMPGAGRATEVAGVKVDPLARVGGVALPLNGAGLRRMFLADVYVIGLYIAERTSSAEAAIQAWGPKRISLTFLREVTAQSLVDALYEGVRDSTTAAEFAELKPAADALSAIMLPLRAARKGDTVALDFLPGTGAQVLVNGQPVGQPIASTRLYRALLKIWLGSPPVDAQLKQALLAGRD